jgi:DNA-binding transcriptional regulator PaaX
LIFDIPENRKKLREYLRTRLKQNWEFYPLQKSVYLTPYPVPVELNKYLTEQNLEKYIRYLTVTEIDGEEELKAYFDLK